MIFMVDSGAEHSVVTKPVAPLIQHRATIIGATGTQTARQFCRPRMCQLGGHEVTHEFLYLPECPIPLLGRDLLTKLGAQITFNQGGL
jgi:predicted aspartyl protease